MGPLPGLSALRACARSKRDRRHGAIGGDGRSRGGGHVGDLRNFTGVHGTHLRFGQVHAGHFELGALRRDDDLGLVGHGVFLGKKEELRKLFQECIHLYHNLLIPHNYKLLNKYGLI